MKINQPVPDFELPDIEGKIHRLSGYRGKIVIVNFWSCECPHSERTDKAILAKLVKWREEVVLLSIESNMNESVEAARQAAKARGLPTVLIDAQHIIADIFDAQTTPHAFVIDRDGVLRYHGAVDDVGFRQRAATRFFLDEAVKSLLEGYSLEITESPAYGCTIIREI